MNVLNKALCNYAFHCIAYSEVLTALEENRQTIRNNSASVINPIHPYQPLHGGHLKNFFIRLVMKSLNTEHLSEFLRQFKILSLKSISILLKPFLWIPKRTLFSYYLFNQWPWLLSIYIGTISSWKSSMLWPWVYFQ